MFSGVGVLRRPDSIAIVTTMSRCPVKQAEQNAKWRAKQIAENPEAYYEKRRLTSLKGQRKKRGMPEPTRPMPAACECCSKEFKQLCCDHNHETGIFRGWLCNDCNLAIGRLGDNLEGIQNAERYLTRAS
jgi:hypothetical protein